MNLFKNRDRLVHLISIELLFILITYLFFAIIWYTKVFPFNADFIFHIRRINELTNDIRHLQLPMFNQYVGMPMGVATLTFYPWLNILPISLLLILHVPPVQALLIGFSLMLFIGLNVAYGSCLSFVGNNYLALLFSYFYCISTIVLCLFYKVMDVGEAGAYFFIPLVFFGWLFWITDGKWKMMTTGLILMSFCHILATALMIFFLITISIVFFNYLTRNKIINGIKSASIVILATSYIWIPMLVLMLSNEITMTGNFKTYKFIRYGGLLYKPFDLLLPIKIDDWTFSDIISLIAGVIMWRHLSRDNRKLLLYATLLLLLTSNIKGFSPILMFENTPLMAIQDVTRLALIYHVIFTYLLVHEINYLLSISKFRHVVNVAIISFVVLFSVYLTIGTVESDVFLGVKTDPMMTMLKSHHKSIMFKINNNSMNNRRLYQAHDFTSSKYDYVPKVVRKVNMGNQINILNPGVHQSQHGICIYSNTPCKSMRIPYVIYNQQCYRTLTRQHKLRICRSSHTLKVTNIHKGWNHIKIATPIMWYRWLAMCLSVLGFTIFSAEIIKDKHSN